jgi:hypothetical protein
MTRRLLILIAGCAIFWLLVSIPAKHLGGGDLALVYSATAMLVCLLPGILTLLWADWAERTDPAQMPMMVLGATGMRMFGVLFAGFLLFQIVPLYREQDGFLIWLLVCYLFTLALEMTLLVKGRSRPDGST